MQAVVLNGSGQEDAFGAAVAAAVSARLKEGDASARIFHLAHISVAPCLGHLDCWVKTPGRCRIHDQGQEIERAVHDADLLVLLTPIRFGGHGSHLKKALDRLIPLISPLFETMADLTHHQRRYARMPRLAFVGWDDAPSVTRTELFRALAESNALNLRSPSFSVLTLDARQAFDERILDGLFSEAVPAPGNASGSREGAVRALAAATNPAPIAGGVTFPPNPAVAVLVGSARGTGASTSDALCAYLTERLAEAGATVERVPATEFARDPAAAQRAAGRLAQADILVVASPLYVDTLTHLTLRALEQVVALRQSGIGPRRARLAGLVNCGFPEPEQTRFAMGQLQQAAAEGGYVFAGGLPVGGGELIHGRALAHLGPVTGRLRKSLDEAAAALAAGGVISPAALQRLGAGTLPAALYRLVGSWHWRREARAHGLAPEALRERPFDGVSDEEWPTMHASGPLPAWPYRVAKRIQETQDVITLVLDDPARHGIAFEAGQYLTLEAEIAGQRVRRAYSLSSAPCEGELRLTVKRIPGGLMSNWLHDHLHVGALVRGFGPSGSFTAGPKPEGGARRLLLVASGSGVTPLAAIARQVLHEEEDAQVILVHGSASPDRAIFRTQLLALAARHAGRFRFIPVFRVAPQGWDGPVGRLDQALLGALLDDLPLTSCQRVMLCGPDTMREAARMVLAARGLGPDRVAEEAFVSPRRAADVPDTAQTAVWLAPEGPQPIPVGPGQTLLDAAVEAGVPIRFSCCSGGCGACRVRIVENRDHVVLDEPNEVDAADRAEDVVPACLARLRGPACFRLA